MDATIHWCNVMPKKETDSVSPYLRKPLRNYEEVTREPAKGETRPDPSKGPTRPGDPGKVEPPSKRDDRR